MDRVNDAYVLMSTAKMNCAQTVLSMYCEQFGLERNLALKLAQGFGGGMGRTGNTCGAVTGAYMVLGLAQKLGSASPREIVEETYRLVREFNQRFNALHGSVICKELTGYDLNKPEELAEAREKKVFASRCPVFVRDSVQILETLLKEVQAYPC
jgi:C_GCAxxG_C_C family probable redox protein